MNIRERLTMAVFTFILIVIGFLLKDDIERIYEDLKAKIDFGSHNKYYGK